MILDSEIEYNLLMTRSEAYGLIDKLNAMLLKKTNDSIEILAVNEMAWEGYLNIVIDDEQHDAEMKRLEPIIQKA